MSGAKPDFQPDNPPVLSGTGGDGPTQLMIMHEKGKVIVRFPEPKLWVAFDANGARNVADCLNAEADFIQRLITKQDRLKYAANRMRDQLITRVTLMLTSMERDGKKPAYMAAHVVDQTLQAVSDLAAMDPNAR